MFILHNIFDNFPNPGVNADLKISVQYCLNRYSLFKVYDILISSLLCHKMTVKKMMYVLYSKTYLHCFKTDHGGDTILKKERNKEYKMV